MDIRVPNLGDGVDSAVVLSILVKPGDAVQADDTLLELETDKAVAPMPAPQSGTVKSISIKEGDKVTTGLVAFVFEGGDESGETAQQASTKETSPVTPVPQVGSPQVVPSVAPISTAANKSIITSPSIKKFAQIFGVDLSMVPGTGRGNRITQSDVQGFLAYIQTLAKNPPAQQSAPGTPEIKTPKPQIDFSKWGDVEVVKASSLRHKIAEKMAQTWQEVPHVTQFETADITQLMSLRKKHNPNYEKKGTKMTVTVFALKAVVSALKAFPQFNSSYDMDRNEVARKKYYHIGVAVDTEAGLIVPVIRDVDKKSLLELSLELNTIAEKARGRKLSLDDLQGGTFTISNLGSLGVGHFTPIINTPEVAILGMGRGELDPKKTTLPLCLSYDHRLIDGADGARFIRHIMDELANFKEEEIKL